MKKIQGLLVAAVAASAFAGSSAFANTAWQFTFAGGATSGSGFFETLGDGSSPSDVTFISGTYSDAFIANGTIDGVVPLGTDGGFIYDNKFGGTPQFSLAGLLFDVNAGALHVNLYTDGVLKAVAYEGGGTPTTDISFSAIAVPEPGSMAMLLAGIGALALVSRRKARA